MKGKILVKNPTLLDIYRHIIHGHDMKKKTFIIMGRPGPTGKTWLWDQLRKTGFNAIEVSEAVGPHIAYNDDANHYIDECLGGVVVIILNRPIRRYGQ